MKYTKTERKVLNSEQIKRLMECDFAGNHSLQKVRDVFAFSIFTGIRYSDIMALRATDVKLGRDSKRYWITLRQQKTKEELTIPILKNAERLLLSYSNYQTSTGWAMPHYSNQKINCYLKIISEILNFSPLTFHQARHTFASTILMDNQVEIKSTSILLGHKNLRSSEVYAHISKDLLGDIVDKVDKQLGNL